MSTFKFILFFNLYDKIIFDLDLFILIRLPTLLKNPKTVFKLQAAFINNLIEIVTQFPSSLYIIIINNNN